MAAEKKTKSSSSETLPAPGYDILFHPVWIARWSYDAVISWFGTRKYRFLLSGLPFIGLLGVVAALPFLPQQTRLTQYLKAYRSAEQAKDQDAAKLTLRRLIVDNPGDPDFRYRLAKKYIDGGDYPAGIQILRHLAPTSSIGHIPSHKELIRLARDPQSGFRMEPHTMLRRLRALNTDNPKDDIVAGMLGKHYVEMKLPLLAEPFLAQAAKDSPEQLFELAQLQRTIGQAAKSKTTARISAELAGAHVNANPESQMRLLWAKVLVWLDDLKQAERVLVEGERLSPERFGPPLAALYMSAARNDAGKSRLARDGVAKLVSKALRLDPDNQQAVDFLLQAVARGATVDQALKTELRQHWDEKSSSGEPQTLAISAAIERLCGDDESAVAKLEQAATADPEYRDLLLDMYHKTGRTKQFEKLAATVIEQRQQVLSEQPDAAEQRTKLAKLFLLLKQPENAVDLLQARHDRHPEEKLGSVLNSAFLQLADGATGLKRLKFLEQALAANSGSAATLTKLAEHAVDGKMVQAAQKVLARAVAEGRVPAFRVLSKVGTTHLLRENYKQASDQLERARRLKPKDPLTLNNLATALARQESRGEEALKRINEAIAAVPGDPPQLLSTRGEVLLVLERWPDAARDLSAAAKVLEQPRVHERLAIAYENMGEPAIAAAHREKAEALRTLGRK